MENEEIEKIKEEIRRERERREELDYLCQENRRGKSVVKTALLLSKSWLKGKLEGEPSNGLD